MRRAVLGSPADLMGPGTWMNRSHEPPGKHRERAAFLLLTAVVFPVLAILIVAGYGFVVWIWQMFAGPPTGH